MKTAFGMALLFAAALAAPAHGAAAATARLIDRDGTIVGHADFTATPHGVLIEIEAKGLSPGAHAVMLHTTASCDRGTQFASAGPSFSFEADRPHGFLAKGGPRAGDLPNQYAGADGVLHAAMFSGAITLGNGAKSIFDRDGVSIVIHAGPDDYRSQPDGHAGARLVCGTIIRTIDPGRHASARRKR